MLHSHYKDRDYPIFEPPTSQELVKGMSERNIQVIIKNLVQEDEAKK